MERKKRPPLTKANFERAKPEEKPYELRRDDGLIGRVQPSGVKTFYVELGRGKRHRLGKASVLTFARAEYLARQKLNEKADFGNVLKDNPRKASLGDFIDADYEPWLRANRRRPDTTLTDLKRNFYSLYDKRLTEICRADLDKHVSEARQAGRSAATIVRSMNNLRAVLRLALDRQYIRENPFRGWEKPKVEDAGVTRYLSTAEERALRAALCERDDKMRRERRQANDWRREREYDLLPEFAEKAFPDHLSPMVLVSLNTGLRYGELTGLEWSAVDLKAKVLTVTGKTAKGAKTRHVPLNAEGVDVLTRWRGEGQPKGLVFANRDGAPIGSVKTAWLRVLSDAGIEDFRWHDLRHTFASKLVQRGVDLPVVRELMGHADFKLTLRYAHLDDAQKTAAVAALNGSL